jgi:hypothetical protein
MSTVSSDALFHFTNNPNFLIGILTNEFLPVYCLEKIEFSKNSYNVAFPMVCFCDIPLSQIKNHIETYGYYGIGMKKSWAEKMKLNPILYLRKKSKLTERISRLFENVQNKDFNNSPMLLQTKKDILELLRYTKPYNGDFKRIDKVIPNVRYYNEREWRFIPDLPDNKRYLTEDQYNNKLLLADANSALQKHKLSFEPDDIKYIFVNNDSEIPTMVSALKRIQSKYPPHVLKILTSRIITCEQILNDF